MDEIYQSIKYEVEHLNKDEISDKLIQLCNRFVVLWKELPEERKQEEMQKAVGLIDREKFLSAILMYSVFTFYVHCKKWMEEMLEMILNVRDYIRENVLYFLYWQIENRFMNYPMCESEYGKVLLWQLFQYICKKYAKSIDGLKWVKETERSEDLVVVIITQFLESVAHGPSKTAQDRCKTLIKAMNKRVLLINTAEAASVVGAIPYAGQYISAYMEELCEKDYLEWHGLSIPFFQCENNMPNIETMNLIVGQIVAIKPCFIVEIGTGSILANLLGRCFPVLSVVTGFSRLYITETQYQVSALNMTDREKWILRQVGKNEKHVISSLFTFGINKQKELLNRNELGLAEGQFLLAVVGTRLDEEITDEFMQMLSSLDNRQVGVVYIGKFDNFEKSLEGYPDIQNDIYYLGMQEDVLAILELCDLFVNPNRLGGGTSAVEAMSKGLPVVSTPYGDVGIIVGEDFWAEDYCEMAELINRYQMDKVFYQRQSELAKRRAEVLLDTDSEFVRVVREFGRRMGEEYNVVDY